jgi:hypothetical protein
MTNKTNTMTKIFAFFIGLVCDFIDFFLCIHRNNRAHSCQLQKQ